MNFNFVSHMLMYVCVGVGGCGGGVCKTSEN